MNRCQNTSLVHRSRLLYNACCADNKLFFAHPLLRAVSLSLGLALTFTATPAEAQYAQPYQFDQQTPSGSPGPIPIPPQAPSAALIVTQSPEILINGKPDRLSPGARIHDANNNMVLPASLTGQRYQVRLVREMNGLVHEVWIIRSLEDNYPRLERMP